MKAAPVFEAGEHRWWIIYDQDERRVIDSNVYVVESNGQSLVLDPGGYEIFPQVLAALAEIVQPSTVRHAFVSHQDPDIASSLPLWNACNAAIDWHVPALWEGFIRHYGALDARFDHHSRRGRQSLSGGTQTGSHPRSLSACFGEFPSVRPGSQDPSSPAMSGQLCFLPATASGREAAGRFGKSLRRAHSEREVFSPALDAVERGEKRLARPGAPAGYRFPVSPARADLCRRECCNAF